ncbi:hypothetical protein [Paeniglutamicibacter sp. Y32M11]|uniref:hypothetical protein n=1 Tax=Paeniglutamicibacter sp. Y32M11 TaxID=2853258 RepID=UPI001C528623|nr:hypothetical protein [Paeniglutamicibacter sp. Y32M11]QXQ10471.1 hypothetical protein KUF55_00435 [Paeniglutamicibacter sp. Y32M11]QXQ10475.1 hypothetical protein KUF55_00475 [Paeniglutamicibacter sp. Y32M11]QXQ10782.1 hypothetical protein KUF55_02215 [Paeniglutamicibacter sp. Y32M11]QXQ10786.1 hypothetical protein KUF55_02270 [Paeniglutamicibacter sp. Y32M11]QXQ11427.1 hypothetical protein KUF55_05915 [Paeniglutamicibacter sp. Y32M11]
MIKIITSAKTLQSKESRKHTTLKELCAPRFIIIRNCFAKQTNQPTTPKELSVNPVSQDARVHYTVPKQQPHHTHHQHHTPKGAHHARLGHARDNTKTTNPPTPSHTPKGIQEKSEPVISGPNSVPKTIHLIELISFQPASERTKNNLHNMNSHNLLIFHP